MNFEKFRKECKSAIDMCRGVDPENEGEIENAVKYTKEPMTICVQAQSLASIALSVKAAT